MATLFSLYVIVAVVIDGVVRREHNKRLFARSFGEATLRLCARIMLVMLGWPFFAARAALRR